MYFDDCPEGWKMIVWPLLDELERLGGKAIQIKEKFGGLRFYYHIPTHHPDNELFVRRVNKAEDLSYKTCQVCGEPGALREGGWVQTLCDDHANGRDKCQW